MLLLELVVVLMMVKGVGWYAEGIGVVDGVRLVAMASSSSKQQQVVAGSPRQSDEWAEKCKMLMLENAEEDRRRADMVVLREGSRCLEDG